MTTTNETDCIIGIVAKPDQPRAAPIIDQLLDVLRKKRLRLLVDEETAAGYAPDRIVAEERADRSVLTNRCSVIIVLGGDGTLISVCRHPAERPPVIIGVNLGTLGFLTEITVDELFGVLEEVLAKTAQLERRRLLETDIYRDGEPPARHTAVNDLVISKDSLARIFPIEVTVDDECAAMLRGDGVIVATPGGSTAYSLAAGGSIVHPQVDAILLTPICPHSLTSRPLVLPGSSRISLQVSAESDGFSVFLTLDGQVGMRLKSGDRVTVTTSGYSFDFAKSPSKNYYEVLGTKLKWAAR